MEKFPTKPKNINHNDDDDTLSSHSIISIDQNQSLINNIGHNLYQLAIKQAHEERHQAKKLRQQNKKSSKIIQQQKNRITINDIDHLFEQKRLRPSTIKNDLMELYEKSTSRIRSMLDIKEIDHFIQTTQNRKNQ
ncbi:unnamed protein product [Rotaria sp. Silwood1]|nr:unnamed protein product [Rotaria sp. Silwood1]CAF3706955.1 unnamed protein product [Rotaria sp. Silwood1]CAF3728413.1 unnamed protein product [Rotaria sp. Silwood1]CAF4898325.1 unnamed protein product [Rotaria sp. Silwood1]CAF4936330.1 unnamed protein product [Rotaria sp. Silwood1]